MATYNVGGNQGTLSSSFKGTVALIGGGTLPRRIKLLEYKIGATGNPNATDTYIQFDISRLSNTTSLAGTVNPTAAASLVAINSFASTRTSCGLFWNFTTHSFPSAPSINWLCAPPRILLIACTARTAKPNSPATG